MSEWKEDMLRSPSVILLCLFWLGGCQLPPSADSTALSSNLDPAPLASNELSRLGRQDLDAGNNGLAVEHFKGAVEKNRDDALAWIGLAAAYDNTKRFDLADRAYAAAIRLQGETFDIANNLGYSYYLRGDLKRALAKLKEASLLDPSNQVVRNNIRIAQSGEQPNRRAAP